VILKVQIAGNEYDASVTYPVPDPQGDYSCTVNMRSVNLIDEKIFGISPEQAVELALRFLSMNCMIIVKRDVL
jgi:hypothetical protein